MHRTKFTVTNHSLFRGWAKSCTSAWITSGEPKLVLSYKWLCLKLCDYSEPLGWAPRKFFPTKIL